MEYKKLSNDDCTSCITKIITVLGLVLSIFMCIVLFFGLYKLNNEINTLKAEQEILINKIFNCHEFDFGYSTEQDLNEYYDESSVNEYSDEDLEEQIDKINQLSTKMLLGGGDHTKDGLETKRLKRDIVGWTMDGVPINSESYAEVKKKNKTKEKQSYFKPPTTSSQTPTTTQANVDSPAVNAHNEKVNPEPTRTVVYTRKSRVMHNDGLRKPRRRFIKRPMLRSFNSNSPDQTVSPDVTILQGAPHRKRHRQRRVESSPRLRPAIHMNGEVSALHQNYENYLGNGRMHHYNKHFSNWSKDVWVENLGMDDYFELNDGYLRFLESGLYFVYAQIYYVDEHDTNGFGVYKNDELVLQCTTTSHTNHRVVKPNTCYTGGVIAFSNGDVLKVHDIEANRYSIFQKGKSFFGAVKLGEARPI